MPLVADGDGQGAGVHIGQGRHAGLAQDLVQADFAAAVEGAAAEIPHDDRGGWIVADSWSSRWMP